MTIDLNKMLQPGGIVPIDIPTTAALVAEVQRLREEVEADNRNLEQLTDEVAQCRAQCFTAADMASAAAQGHRDGVASVQSAVFDKLPEGTTHLGKITCTPQAGGRLSMTTHAFKYEGEVLTVYQTDNDNEYPGWRAAKDCFFHLNFPVYPVNAAAPVAQQHVPESDCGNIKAQQQRDDAVGIVCYISENRAVVDWYGEPPAPDTKLYAAPVAQQQEPDLTSLLFAVEQTVENGHCPWEIEAAFDEYEAARKAAPVAQQPQAEHDLNDVRCECCGYMTHHREHMGCIRAASKQPQAEAVPPGYALVPKRMTKAMEYVTEQEDWTWEDLLAAVEVEYSEIAQADAPVDHIPQAFNAWWDVFYDDSNNPFSKGSAAYWAWAGWQAALEQPQANSNKWIRGDLVWDKQPQAEAVPLLSDSEITELMPPPDIDGSKARSPNAVRLAMRAVEQAVRAKLGVAVPMPPEDWSVFNTGAEVASGLTWAEAWDYMTPSRIERGWTAVCVANKSNIGIVGKEGR